MRRPLPLIEVVLALYCCVSSATHAFAEELSASPLADAVEKQESAEVEQLLNAIEQRSTPTVDVNAPQADGMTALHWAVYHDATALVQRLIAAQAKVDVQNRYGVTPLSIACINGNIEVVRLLLENKADPKHALLGDETPLHTAARTGKVAVVNELIRYGADVDARDRKEQTAIMWAAAEGHAEVIDALIAAGANPLAELPSGFNALFFAVRAGRTQAVDSLLRAGADVNQALKPAKSISRGPRHSTSPLIMAIENGHFELAIQLVDAGADPNDQRSGYAPLHTLSWVRKPNRGDGEDGDPPPTGSGKIDSLQFVREIVKRGAQINLQLERGSGGRGKLNRRGATPLLMAAITADLPLMKLFVQLGANPLLPNSERCTPFMAAAGIGSLAPGEEAGTEPEVLETLQYLLELGADVNSVDEHGETAIHGAAYKSLPKVVAFLAEHGASPEIWNKCNAYGWTPLSIASGTRVGNFKPNWDTMAAIELVLKEAGLAPAKPTAAAVDPYAKTVQLTPKPTVGQVKGNSAGKPVAQEPVLDSLAQELGAIVEQQARDWNRGDIDAFMTAYWQSEELTFSSGGDVERGWKATRERYKRRYPDRQTMGKVTFSELEVQALDDNAALMLGRWHLEREQPVGGAFTLVWKKLDGRWLIVHDHTSVKDK